MDRKAKKRKLAAEAATMSVEELQRILQHRNRDKLTLEVFKRELVRRNILDAFSEDIYPKSQTEVALECAVCWIPYKLVDGELKPDCDCWKANDVSEKLAPWL